MKFDVKMEDITNSQHSNKNSLTYRKGYDYITRVKIIVKETNSMKSVIIVASVHHGNTRKVVDAIANEFDIDVIDATKVKEIELSGYDLIGFASGVYGFNLHQSIINFASANLPVNKKIFLLTTSAMNKDFSQSFMQAIKDKNATVVGKFSCHGYNTFGPFKLVGGTSKGHPNDKDTANAIEFYKKLIE